MYVFGFGKEVSTEKMGDKDIIHGDLRGEGYRLEKKTNPKLTCDLEAPISAISPYLPNLERPVATCTATNISNLI
ncbi:unnamed protein product [Lactuca virosa]|uniref:Uncharacterized protein n=1 Tax=Lactuca virosa TaxID=75947 RepID=A0AAU9PTL8_9ASTR|nr:unnamed protein product [Lactuca virosa]